jgi:DNA recombination protein RmuC
MEASALIIAGLLLLAGLAIGWFLGQRQADVYRRERDARLDDFRQAITDLAAAEERCKALPGLQTQLDAARQACSDAQQQCARLASAQEEKDKAFEARLVELKEAREALSAQFSEIGGKLLGEAQKHFLERADARFDQAGQKSEEKLKLLLQPVAETLKRYEEGLSKVEKERVDHYAGLREAVELVRSGQTQVRDETARLVNALRSSPKARGRWGEQSLRNVLEQAGLSEFSDFRTEVSVDTADGRLRPDVIVRMPGGRKLIIDAKCSLNAFLDASEEVDELERVRHLKAHAVSIRNHAQQLGSKAYWSEFGDAADYVVMYIPGEHFLTAALEQDEALWEWAFERKVLLATPTNLVAIARTVAGVWRQEKLAEEAAEIARLGKELYSRLATMSGHVSKLGRNLELATGAYNSFVGSLESQVLTQAKRFESLGVPAGSKTIDDLPMIDTAPRTLTKLLQEQGAQPSDS